MKIKDGVTFGRRHIFYVWMAHVFFSTYIKMLLRLVGMTEGRRLSGKVTLKTPVGVDRKDNVWNKLMRRGTELSLICRRTEYWQESLIH